MPRTWGYIIIVAALVVGAAALLLPLPENVELAPVEQPKTETPVTPAATPAPRAPVARARGQKAGPTPPPAVAPAPKPATPPVPMQDTTKTRQLIQPKHSG
jgi:hypothetical protein